MSRIAIGATAGAAATVPMTWSMELLHRLLPVRERYALPPREITDRIEKLAGVENKLDEEHRFWLALGSHFGYGASVGSIYAALADVLPGRPIVKGTAFGLAVWAGSYLGMLPALGILRTATRHPARRTGLMIAAHAVWGSALGIFTDLLEKGSKGEGLVSLERSNETGESDDKYPRHARVSGEAATAR